MRIFRTACAIAQLDQIERAQVALLQVPVGPDFRQGAARYEPLPKFETFAATGSDGRHYLVSARPVAADPFDGPGYRGLVDGARIEFIAELKGPSGAPLDVILSHSQFHYTTGREDLQGKLAEHVAAILPRAGLTRIEPQREAVQQLEWGAPPSVRPLPLPLPNGCFCTIHEILSSPDRGLVLVVDHWDSQAAYDRGDAPHSSHDHGFGAFKSPVDGRHAEKRRCQASDDVRARILRVLCQAHAPGVRKIAVDDKWLDAARPNGKTDHWGFLAHPHVQALEVTP